MAFRTCTKCHASKREDENHYYRRQRKNGTASWSTICKACHRLATRKSSPHYREPEYIILSDPMARYAAMPMRGVCWL